MESPPSRSEEVLLQREQGSLMESRDKGSAENGGGGGLKARNQAEKHWEWKSGRKRELVSEISLATDGTWG